MKKKKQNKTKQTNKKINPDSERISPIGEVWTGTLAFQIWASVPLLFLFFASLPAIF